MSTIDVLVFSLRGRLAHFRQPDTTVTQATYPFPPRPTLLGLVAAVLGIDYTTPQWPAFLEGEHYLGLVLAAPVRTVCMQMSLLGKGFVSGESTGSFNRPTVVEMVVAPHYRVYYAGESLLPLKERISRQQSVYHTYLGTAYCLTFPEYEASYEADILQPAPGEAVAVSSVVPRAIIDQVCMEGGSTYAAARATPYRHRGDRTFSGTATIFYETSGKPLRITLKTPSTIPYRMARMPGGEVVCLW